jgi:FAD/FMN-containing dehydrogenase
VIPRGAGRSQGDCAYVGNGVSCTSSGLHAVHAFDEATATIDVGAGLPVGVLHRHLSATPMEFPVFGGTQWATVGGGIAADLHGKNHPDAGSFGTHVRELTLLTADGTRVTCSPHDHPDLFAATIGGLGLTGFVESARLALRPAHGRVVRQRYEMVHGFGQMLDAFAASDDEFNQAVWFDLAHRGGVGLFCSAHRVEGPARDPQRTLRLPLPRVRIVRPTTARMASAVVGRAYARAKDPLADITTYNYSGSHELVFHWNRLFGGAGTIEFQFVLSDSSFEGALCDFVTRARRLSIPLLSAVVKRLGPIAPAGMLSFPTEGYTLTVQTAFGTAAVRFLREFTEAVVRAGGRVNLTKDACTTAAGFAPMYAALEAWQAVAERYDPVNRIGSNMSRRLALKPW